MRKYYGITKSKNGNTYRCEIWDDPSGSATGGTELRMESPGFSITYNQQGGRIWEDQIQSSKIQAQFVVTETADHDFFKNLAVEYEGKFVIAVYKNDNIFYIGRIIADQMQYQRRPETNSVYTVTGVDSLSLFENVKVKLSWFNTTTKRMSILELVRKTLEETYVMAYYNHLGFADDFIMDIGADLPTGAPGYFSRLEFNLASTIENLTNYINVYNDEDIYIDCALAISRLLRVSGCKLIYANGLFTLYDPILSATNPIIFAFVYATDGTYKTRPTVNTQYLIGDGVRPCFSAFPTLTHQPALKYIKQTFLRTGFNFTLRRPNNQSSSVLSTSLSVSDSIGTSLNVGASISWNSQSFTGTAPPKQQYSEINFRIYVFKSGLGYKHYDYQAQTWGSYQANKPFYERIRCQVTDYQVINSQISTQTIDFQRNFLKPPQEDFVEVEFLVGSLRWNFTTASILNTLSFWGIASIYEQDLTPRLAFTENTKNPNATDTFEESVVYGYNLSPTSPNGIGTIWRSDINFASDLKADYWSQKVMSVYADSPKVMQANLIDDGDYYAILCPTIDDETYVFNGGQFNALNETWDLELIKIAEGVDVSDYSELDSQDEIDPKKGDNTSVFRIIQQTQDLRDSVSNLSAQLPLDLLRLSPDTPMVVPTINTEFIPLVSYNVESGFATWNVQETGKSVTLGTGTHELDVTAELILCNSSTGNVVINLPNPALVKGRKYYIKKTAPSSSVQLNGTIDGTMGYSFGSKDDCKVIMSDGIAFWFIAYYHK
jgi:hypothetical protein